MNDPVNRLESELAAMRPAPMAPELADRIAAELKAGEARTSPWPDRFLLSAICSGAIAACVIFAMLMGDWRKPSQDSQPVVVVNSVPKLGDSVLAIARMDGAWAQMSR